MRIAVFGLGYVGTVTAAGLASQGHQVCGVDVDAVKVDHIRSGRSPVVEPGIDELIATAVGQGDLSATTDACRGPGTAPMCPCSASVRPRCNKAAPI